MNEWWGNRNGGDKDDWQANWDNQLSSKEHRVALQGSEEDRVGEQGSEENNEGGGEEERRSEGGLMGLLFDWWDELDELYDLTIFRADEIGDAPNDACMQPESD